MDHEYKNTCVACGNPCGYTGLLESADCSNPKCRYAYQEPQWSGPFSVTASEGYIPVNFSRGRENWSGDIDEEIWQHVTETLNLTDRRKSKETRDKVSFLGIECSIRDTYPRSRVYSGQHEHLTVSLHYHEFKCETHAPPEWNVYVQGRALSITSRGPDLKDIEDEVSDYLNTLRSELDTLVLAQNRSNPEKTNARNTLSLATGGATSPEDAFLDGYPSIALKFETEPSIALKFETGEE